MSQAQFWGGMPSHLIIETKERLERFFETVENEKKAKIIGTTMLTSLPYKKCTEIYSIDDISEGWQKRELEGKLHAFDIISQTFQYLMYLVLDKAIDFVEYKNAISRYTKTVKPNEVGIVMTTNECAFAKQSFEQIYTRSIQTLAKYYG
jgi:hypothetical protein